MQESYRIDWVCPIATECPRRTADVIGRHVNDIMATYIAVSSLIRQGTLRAIAVGGANRLSFLPDVPTLNESTAPGYDLDNSEVR